MDDQDTNQKEKKRFRWLKLAFVFTVILKQILLIARCLVLYVLDDDFTMGLGLAIFIPCFVISTLFSALQLHAILHELNEDLKWFRTWYYRLFVLYSLHFWLNLYPVIVVLIIIYTAIGGAGDFYPCSYMFDIAEPMLCLLIQALMLILFFRPYMSCLNSNITANQQQSVYSVSQSQMTFTNIRQVQSMTSTVIYQSNESCCERKALFVFSIIFYCIYCVAFLALIYQMMDQRRYNHHL